MVDFVDYIQETVIKAKAKGIGDYPNVIIQFQSRFTRKAIRPGLFWNSWAWEGGGGGGGRGGGEGTLSTGQGDRRLSKRNYLVSITFQLTLGE